MEEEKETRRDLLELEHKNPFFASSSFSDISSTLLVCKNKKKKKNKNKKKREEEEEEKPPSKPTIASLPKSQFLDKVKGFLGVMAEANKRLEEEAAQGNSEAFDIEALTGNETQVIEMDLMLGVADLNTPEAVVAAEAAIAGNGLVPESEDSDSDEEEESKKQTKIIELS
ncbi:unnamed protein product [Cochlearia groenlandica]